MTEEHHQSTPVEPRPSYTPNECKICGVPAIHNHFGVLTCASCKIFFRRNAKNKQRSFQCPYDGNCEININTRHVCAYCRLKKCFDCGMQTDLFRDTISKKSIRKPTGKTTQSNQLQLISTLNLLQADQSTFTIEQWNLISNLIHCYDEHSHFRMAIQYKTEQNILPLKMRFKLEPMFELTQSIMKGGQLLFEKNADFLSLSSHDRSLLLHNNYQQTAGFGACFILFNTRLYHDPVFYENCRMIYGQALSYSSRAGDRLDPDIVFIKLVLGILMFSTYDYTYYNNQNSSHLGDIKAVLRLQDMYTELAWRYLVYRYDHQRAVLSFSNLIRCLFFINYSIVTAAAETQQYNTMIDSLVKQTEQVLETLN